jgi:L-serine/L-threonine ammonia-lyase
MDDLPNQIPLLHNDDAPTTIRDLYVSTPLIKSEPLSQLIRTSSNACRDVYIKLDNLQRSGSYKDRGMANLLWQKQMTTKDNATTDNSNRITRIVCSSGGNAGLAAATVARDLQLHCTVVIPKTTKAMVIEKLQTLQAHVVVTGNNWNEADDVARTMVQSDKDNTTLYVPPYDHPLLWTGISSVIDEIYSTESFIDKPPSTIVLSVGGGGLLCGVLEGLEKMHQRNHCENKIFRMPRIICAETDGAASFNISWKAGKILSLQEISSIATSLGALTITPSALQRSAQYQSTHGDSINNCGTIASALCTDAEAVDACLKVLMSFVLPRNMVFTHFSGRMSLIFFFPYSNFAPFVYEKPNMHPIRIQKFARDHRMLVEPACGAALAVLYSDRLRNQFFLPSIKNEGPIVIEICGGSGVNIDLLQEWKIKMNAV